MGIVFAKDCFVELHHLDACYYKAFTLKTGYYIAYEAAVYSGGLEYDEGLLHGGLLSFFCRLGFQSPKYSHLMAFLHRRHDVKNAKRIERRCVWHYKVKIVNILLVDMLYNSFQNNALADMLPLCGYG